MLNSLYLEGAHKSLVNTHHCACIIKLPTVVRGRKEGHQLPFGKKLIAVFYHLLEGEDKEKQREGAEN